MTEEQQLPVRPVTADDEQEPTTEEEAAAVEAVEETTTATSLARTAAVVFPASKPPSLGPVLGSLAELPKPPRTPSPAERKGTDSIDKRSSPEVSFDPGGTSFNPIGYTRHAVPSNSGPSREFRVVRDNRVNGNTNRELMSNISESSSSNEHAVKGSTANSSSLKASAELGPSQATNGHTVSHGVRHNRDANGGRPNSSQNQSATVVGVYSSATDPVHVPSPDARPSAAVGAIKREVGVVGGRRQTSGSPISAVAKDSPLSEPFQPFLAISKNDQVSHQANASEAVVSGVTVSRSFLGGQYSSRPHQQSAGHQKASQHNKEWKPKTFQKVSVNGPGVIGTPTKSSSPVGDNSKGLKTDAGDLPHKLSRVKINENQNVIIAQHIRVPDTDRCRLTFGSFGVELDSARNFSSGFSTVGVTEENKRESTTSLTASVAESTGDAASGTKHDEVSAEKLRHSGSVSPASGGASEPQLPDKSPSPPNLDNYADISLVQETSPSYDHAESHHQHQDPPELQSFQGTESVWVVDMGFEVLDGLMLKDGFLHKKEANSGPIEVKFEKLDQHKKDKARSSISELEHDWKKRKRKKFNIRVREKEERVGQVVQP
ncbi:unnamed protein product [Linum tenue]|uniref:Uncharacterized protein n=1 Tax=Linum tenue TaxID=586396 RepID=A0AAV0HJQ2_9ROSI|nr:unnamed protein product [Linum tenue]